MRPPTLQPDSDSEDELPPGWEEKTCNEGQVFYVNHQEKRTQWTHPRTGKSKRVFGDLPFGWEKEIEEGTGKEIFIDRTNETKTYTDPRLAFAVENLPKNISEVRQRFPTDIGFETARSLAFYECEIVFACRSQNAEQAIEKIKNEKFAAGEFARLLNWIFVRLDRSQSACERSN